MTITNGDDAAAFDHAAMTRDIALDLLRGNSEKHDELIMLRAEVARMREENTALRTKRVKGEAMIGLKEQLAYADTITKELRQEVLQLQQQLATETAALKEALASENFACRRADAATQSAQRAAELAEGNRILVVMRDRQILELQESLRILPGPMPV